MSDGDSRTCFEAPGADLAAVAIDLVVDGRRERVERTEGGWAAGGPRVAILADADHPRSIERREAQIASLDESHRREVRARFEEMRAKLAARLGAVDELPGGDRQIVALSHAWALATVTRPGAPFVFDDPLRLLYPPAAERVEEHLLAACGQAIVATSRPLRRAVRRFRLEPSDLLSVGFIRPVEG